MEGEVTAYQHKQIGVGIFSVDGSEPVREWIPPHNTAEKLRRIRLFKKANPDYRHPPYAKRYPPLHPDGTGLTLMELIRWRNKVDCLMLDRELTRCGFADYAS